MFGLLDSRFANDIFDLPATKQRLKNVLDSLMRHLAAAELEVNTSKDVTVTTEAPPPSVVGCYNAKFVLSKHRLQYFAAMDFEASG